MFKSCCVCDTRESDAVTELDVDSPVTCYTSVDADQSNTTSGKAVQLEEERERLVALVYQFTQTTVDGIPCQLVKHYNNEGLSPCRFRLLPDMQGFEIVNTGPSKDEACTCESQYIIQMLNICEVYTWPDLLRLPKLANVAKSDGIHGLTEHDRTRLVVIEFVDDRQYLQRLCLLVPPTVATPKETETVADVFATILRMLRIHAKIEPPIK